MKQLKLELHTNIGTNLCETMLGDENINKAIKHVKSKKGSAGIDGMTVQEIEVYMQENKEEIKSRIQCGKYKPKAVRKVEIPKPNGGVRKLGIPCVIDRVIQQMIVQVLQPIFEPTFSEYSYGFRPQRNAHMALKQAKEYINEGYKWVVDVDLEKFFDKVNHDKLMMLVSQKVKDKAILRLIGNYLRSGILEGGIVNPREEGVMQGGPLSPLLSLIMLDPCDKMLEEREAKFCRYADDIQIYVKSKRAGERQLKNLTKYLENNLKLKVNKDKSKVGLARRSKYLGFSFYYSSKAKEYRIRIHPKSIERLKEKIRKILKRNIPMRMEERYRKLGKLINGWVNYYKIADMKSIMMKLDSWMRHKVRTVYWKQWKKVRTRYKNLRRLGINHDESLKLASSRKGYYRCALAPAISKALNNEYLEKEGCPSLLRRYTTVNIV